MRWGGDTSVALAMKQLTFLLRRFSFGESKSNEVDVEVVAMAATSLDESSSSSLSSSPVEFFLFVQKNNLCLLLVEFLIFDKGLLFGNL